MLARIAASLSAALLACSIGAQAVPRAYIANSGDGTVSVIDTATQTVIATIFVGGEPYGVAVHPTGNPVYIGAGSKLVTIDATDNTIRSTIARKAYGVTVNPLGTYLYAAGGAEGPVLFVETRSGYVRTRNNAGTPAVGIAVDAMDRYVFVPSTRYTEAWFPPHATPTPDTSYSLPGYEGGDSGVAVHPKKAFVYIVDGAHNRVTADLDTYSVYIPVGQTPFGIAVDPPGTFAFVTNTGGNSVSVIDLASNKVVATVGVGLQPKGIAVDPSGRQVYVANYGSDTVSVIDTKTLHVSATIGVGHGPVSLGQFIGEVSDGLTLPNYQGLWWNSPPGSESGWGLNIAHQGDTLFATWFTYDESGNGMWLVMPEGDRQTYNSFVGMLYRSKGPPFSSTRWDATKVAMTLVGAGVFEFTDESNGTFRYNVNNVVQTKTITRLLFGSPQPVCRLGAAPSESANFQDLWWGTPEGSESGWGVNVVHQGDIVFATWFTYAGDGVGMWIEMPRGDKVPGSSTFQGDLYRTNGPAFSANPWASSQVTSTRVGTGVFTFSDADHGRFDYTLYGLQQSKPITRLRFSTPATVCK